MLKLWAVFAVISTLSICRVSEAHALSDPVLNPNDVTRPRPPVFPDSYEIGYKLSLPFVHTVQSGGLSYPVHVWYEKPTNRVRTDVFYGLDSVYQEGVEMVTVYPRINRMACDIFNSTAGPTSNSLKEDPVPPPLPDFSNWQFGGMVEGVAVWKMSDKQEEKVSTYTFYTSVEGAPIKLVMMGFNILAGSHYDEYIFDFTYYKPGPIADIVFGLPKACNGKDTVNHLIDGPSSQMRAILSLHPGRQLASPPSSHDSLLLLLPSPHSSNAAFVASHNRRPTSERSYSTALNRWSAVTHADWAATQLGRGKKGERARKARGPAHLSTYQRLLSNDRLPKSVDWRGSGADGIVKDQATCGSCWAFAAVGTMQGAWYLATGIAQSLSEQQFVDCSWNEGNNGCGGGFQEMAMDYAIGAGGVMSEEQYKYVGQNSFCSATNHTNFASEFDGYVSIPTRDDEALMEAVYLHGPLAVSIDADHLGFRFYSEGVFDDEECKTGPDELDHAVVLVGYGTSDEGKDYWLIRNSWSTYWGEAGYVKMARKNDCGVSTDAVLAVVSRDRVRAVTPGGLAKGGYTANIGTAVAAAEAAAKVVHY